MASLVRLAGIDLGERLLPGNPTNEPGHFEDLDFVNFHQELLVSLGLAEHGICGTHPPSPPATSRERAIALVELRRSRGVPWGWKDPRGVLFLPFWASVAAEARFLLVFRPPWDVVDSLFRRGDDVVGRNPVLALEAWLVYNRAIRDFARTHAGRVEVVELADVIGDPEAMLERVRDRFAIPLEPKGSTFDRRLLREADPGAAAFLADRRPECEELLAELRLIARSRVGRSGPADPTVASEWAMRAWRNGSMADGAFTLAARLEASLGVANVARGEAHAALDAANATIAGLHASLAAAGDARTSLEAERSRRIAELESRLREADAAIGALAGQRDRADRLDRELHEALARRLALESERDRLATDLRAIEARAASLAAELAATRRLVELERDSGRSALAEADSARARAESLVERLAGESRRADASTREAEELAGRTRELKVRIRSEAELARSRVAAGEARIAELEDVVRRIRGSTAWRITAPLRRIAHAFHEFRRRLANRRGRAPVLAPSAAAAPAISPRTDPAPGVPAGSTASVSPRDPDTILISVLVPVYETPPTVLRKTIHSVFRQTHPRWELVIVDDGSSSAEVRAILARTAEEDGRVTVHFREANGGIGAATNAALGLAGGEFVAFLDHDDELEPEALARCAAAIAERDADVVYTDQDTIDPEGRVLWTFRKPDWSPEYFRHVMYVGHLLVVRRSLAVRVGGIRSEFDGVQDFEFMLRLSEMARSIVHVPEVLYHWRAIPGSLAASVDAKRGIAELQVKAVQEHLDRLAIPAEARPDPARAHRCILEPRLASHPRVSIIIPSRDRPDLLGPCLASILGRSTYPDLEVIVVDNGTSDPEALRILREHLVRVIDFPGPFNYSAANNLGAAAASGEVLVFLNNDTEVVSPDWLERIVRHLSFPGVAAAGPLLLYPDGSVQHAGVVLGARGTADHVYRRFPADVEGYAGTLSSSREVSALTGACLAVRRDAFEAVGGFRAAYATHYQDVDLCLRFIQASLRCVFVADARLVHHESPSRGGRYDFLDRLLLIDTWQHRLAAGDPFYPDAFCLDRLDYSPRTGREAGVG